MGAGYRSSYTRRKFRLRYEFSLQQARLADAVTSKVLLTWHKRSQVFFILFFEKNRICQFHKKIFVFVRVQHPFISLDIREYDSCVLF